MDYIWIILIIIGSILLLIILLLFITALVMVHKVSYPLRYETSYTHEVDVSKGLLDGIEVLKRVPIIIKMKDNYLIHGDVSLNAKKTNKWMIITHGYSWTREGSLKYAKIFYKAGFNILIYDNRSHGENKHNAVAMGYKESSDLHEIINYVENTYGKDVYIGLHGESLGAAITLLSLKYKDPHVKFVISDSSYSSLKDLFTYQTKVLYHLPLAILPFASLLLKINHGYFIKDINVANVIKEVDVPILLVHGDSDTFIPKDEAYKLKNANPSCVLKLYKGCDHTQSVIHYPKEYEEMCLEFINNLKEGN